VIYFKKRFIFTSKKHFFILIEIFLYIYLKTKIVTLQNVSVQLQIFNKLISENNLSNQLDNNKSDSVKRFKSNQQILPV